MKDGIPSGGRLWSDALGELLGPARDPAAPLEDSHRDIARSAQVTYENASSISWARCTALPDRRGRARRRLRLQLGGQRQGPRALAVQGGLHPVGRRRRRRRDRRGLRHLAQGRGDKAKRHFVMDHAYWGPSATPEQIAVAIAGRRADFEAAGCTIDAHRRRGDAVQAHRRGDRRRQGHRLVPGPHRMGPARARQPLDPGRPAPRRHEGHPQSQDQAPRVVPAVRAVDPARGGARTGSRPTTTCRS